jgi:heme exporter protein A
MSVSSLKQPEILLAVEGLSCVRRGRRLFENLEFSVISGGTTVLAGANGCGKSSLMKMIAGLLPADTGTVRFKGTPIRTTADYEGDVIYLGHKNAVKPEASVRENIFFWAHITGNEMLAAMAMEYWSLGPWLDMPAGMLSAGWQRRVALSRLISVPAQLWLLDEPMSNLDADGVALLGELIKSRTASGGAVIMVAHGISDALAKQEGLQVVQVEQFAPKCEHENL